MYIPATRKCARKTHTHTHTHSNTGRGFLTSSGTSTVSPQKKILGLPLNRRLAGRHNRTELFGDDKNLLPLPGI